MIETNENALYLGERLVVTEPPYVTDDGVNLFGKHGTLIDAVYDDESREWLILVQLDGETRYRAVPARCVKDEVA